MDLKKNNLTIGRAPALILVDMIQGFTDPACPLGHDCPQVVAANRQLLDAFRQQGHPVFFTTVEYQQDDQAKVFRKRIDALNWLQPDSRWVKIDDRLQPQGGEALIKKHWASAFHKTDLDDQLQALGVDSLVVTGLTTSGCVRATAVDGLQYDYVVLVPEEAVGDRNMDAHKANLFDLNAKYADVVSVEAVLQGLEEINIQI